MRRVNGIVIAIGMALALALAGCGGAGAPAGSAPAAAADGGTAAAGSSADAGTAAYTSAALPASYENALPASTQLALGILRLEDTPQAVTSAQAKTLLPLWQAFQGRALQNETERNAVLKQIEGSLTTEQVKAIAAMQLNQDDIRQWMEENGPGPGTPFPGGPPGGFGDMTDEQRAAFRATAEASGGQFTQGPGPRGTPGAGGGPGNMTDEQRAAFRATVEASGGQFPGGGQNPRARGTPGPGGQGRFSAPYRIFVGPLVELLTQRATG
jgi:uncharacterized lipoprotein YbaY